MPSWRGCRIIVSTCMRIYYLKKIISVPKPTFEAMNLVIIIQILLHYTLMAAMFLCLKPFLSTFDKELWHASHLDFSMKISFLQSRQTHDHKRYMLHSVEKEQNTSIRIPVNSKKKNNRTDVERAPLALIEATASRFILCLIEKWMHEWMQNPNRVRKHRAYLLL